MKNTLCRLLNKLEQLLKLKPPAVTILAYHSISNDGTIVDVRKRNFRSQMKFLKEGFKFVNLEEALKYSERKIKFEKPAVAITFDDGYADIIKNVLPLLKKYKIPTTIFILSQPSLVNRGELKNRKELLSFQQVKKLTKEGWSIGCHSATHQNLSMPTVDLYSEVIESKKKLEGTFKIKVNFFAFPKGEYTPSIFDYLKDAGYQAAFSVEPYTISKSTNKFTFPRISIDRTHTDEQFEAFFTNWGRFYLQIKARLDHPNFKILHTSISSNKKEILYAKS